MDKFDYDLIKEDAIGDFMTSAVKKRYSYFRLILTPEEMVYYNKYSDKFPLVYAIVTYWNSKGDMHQILFNKTNSNMSFQAAGYKEDSMVFCLDTPDIHLENEWAGGGNESLLITLRSNTSTIFIAYDGDHDFMNVTFCKDSVDQDQPAIAEMLQKAFNLPRRH